MRKSEEEQSAKVVRTATSLLFGGVIALFVCFVFLFLCAMAISAGKLSEDLMYQFTVVSCLFGGFSGGLVCVRRIRRRTVLVGLGSGVVLFLLLMTAGILFFEQISVFNGGIGILCGCLCGGAAAGIMGGKPKKKRRK